MPRYIDAEKIRLPGGFFEKVNNVPKFYEWLETLPTADVRENVHGKWVAPATENVYRCSVCEEYATLEVPGLFYHYCPNCGAIMDL